MTHSVLPRTPLPARRAGVWALLATALALAVTAVLAPAHAAASDARPIHDRLVGVFAFGACPAEAPAGALCLHDRVSGRIDHVGEVTGEFDVVIDAAKAGADGCAPISKRGSFVRPEEGDRLDIRGDGTFCFATAVATYAYTITGGSGKFDDASGTGTWLVPAPTVFDGVSGVGDEVLDGTLRR
jgi:hypothetical protein